MEEKESNNWRDSISETETATLKVQDGEELTVVFMDEGELFVHHDFGKSIVFRVQAEAQDFRWYVNPNNFALLKQIKELGTLTGLKVKIKRTGWFN